MSVGSSVHQTGQPCRHERRTLATNITAWIQHGHLQGGDPNAPVLPYDAILFCSSPTCEHVFHAERAGAIGSAARGAR